VIVGLDHVQIAAPQGCEQAARAFYGTLLGLAELPKPAALQGRGGVWFAVGERELHVGVQAPFTPATKAHPGLRVLDGAALEQLAERLRRGGHDVRWEDDGSRLHTDDPFGNRIELLAGSAVTTRTLRSDERDWARAILIERWGEEVVGDENVRRPADLPVLLAEAGGERIGLATWILEGDHAELITLDTLREGAGAGGALVEAVAAAAQAAGARKLRLTTTNDNLPALRLYQRHGFVLAALRRDAIARARKLKPSLPATGHAGIPLRDELELVRAL
jgi:ribosomal protein S18 acetylase RimI-like enzyme